MAKSISQLTQKLAYWFRLGKFPLGDPTVAGTIFPWLSASDAATVQHDAAVIAQFPKPYQMESTSTPLDNPFEDGGPTGSPRTEMRAGATIRCVVFGKGAGFETYEIHLPWGSDINDIMSAVDSARKKTDTNDVECSIEIVWGSFWIY